MPRDDIKRVGRSIDCLSAASVVRCSHDTIGKNSMQHQHQGQATAVSALLRSPLVASSQFENKPGVGAVCWFLPAHLLYLLILTRRPRMRLCMITMEGCKGSNRCYSLSAVLLPPPTLAKQSSPRFMWMQPLKNHSCPSVSLIFFFGAELASSTAFPPRSQCRPALPCVPFELCR